MFGAYRGVQTPEATLAHIEAGWWEVRAADYGPITRSRLEMGSKITAIEYVKAQRLRQTFAQGMCAVMQQVDMLALPTLPILPPRRDQLDQPIWLGDQEYEPGAAMLRFTLPFNLPASRRFAALRFFDKPPPHRTTTGRPSSRGDDHLVHRPRLSAGHGLASAPAVLVQSRAYRAASVDARIFALASHRTLA